MHTPNFIILYVDNPVASAEFYEARFQQKALEVSPTFAMFKLNENLTLGLWSKHTVEPSAQGSAGFMELAFTLPTKTALENLHQEWSTAGLKIIQAPVAMDFGYTFVALDPDNHRLRAFCPLP